MASKGPPRYVPCAMADRIVGLTAVGGILAALLARQRTGRGQRVDVPMFETMVGFVLGDHLGGLSFEPPLDEGGYARQLSPERRPYRTSDGYICALVYNDKQWQGFLRAIGRESLLQEDARFATFANRSRNIDFVYGELARIFEQRSTAEWMALLEEADMPMMPMHDLKSVLDDPHLVATKFFTTSEHPSEGTIRSMRMPMTWSDSTPEPARPAPRLGEHSVEVLRAGRLQRRRDRRADRPGRRAGVAPRPRRRRDRMNFALSEQQEGIREAIAKVCARFDDAYWFDRDHDGRFPEEFYRALADDGWLGMCIGEQYGGVGPRHHRGGDHDADDRRSRAAACRRRRRCTSTCSASTRWRCSAARSSAGACCRRWRAAR